MSGANVNNIPSDVFDPTSAASMTASALLLVGILCAGSSAYAMGKFREEKARLEYQMGMWIVVSAVALFGAGVYIAWAFD